MFATYKVNLTKPQEADQQAIVSAALKPILDDAAGAPSDELHHYAFSAPVTYSGWCSI